MYRASGPRSPREGPVYGDDLPQSLLHARPVWHTSFAPRGLIVSAAGLNISKRDLCALIASKWPVQAMRVDQNSQSVEVALEAGADPKEFREAGLVWRNMQFAIEEPREPMASFFDVVLTGLPLLSEGEAKTLIESSLQVGPVVRIVTSYCEGTNVHCGRFVATIKGDRHDMVGHPRHIEMDGERVLLTWNGASPLCFLCREKGHAERDCERHPDRIRA